MTLFDAGLIQSALGKNVLTSGSCRRQINVKQAMHVQSCSFANYSCRCLCLSFQLNMLKAVVLWSSSSLTGKHISQTSSVYVLFLLGRFPTYIMYGIRLCLRRDNKIG